ncbi:MAG: SDR family NAD(P)-dependent oxidoreductase [Planctomycetota bacterium]|nr:MAG: SDR family NAD(P)-dependent oxidoreductase [Planctomycetota bacterium]
MPVRVLPCLNMDLKNGTAIVTGASKGIGRAIAEALAREGMRLVIGARTAGPLEEAARAIGGEVETVVGDVGDESVAARLVQAAARRFGRIDVVVNNAGIGHHGRLEDMDPAEFDRIYRTNVRGPFLLMRAAIPMMRGKGGTLVTLASLAGKNPVPNRAAYAASKWAMIGLSRSVLQEVRKDGIRVIILEPGSTLTDFGHDAAKMAQAEKLVRPEDVAAVLVSALKLPARATVSEIEIRPTDPPG